LKASSSKSINNSAPMGVTEGVRREGVYQCKCTRHLGDDPTSKYVQPYVQPFFAWHKV
jgi:hypothetical protein